MRGSIYPDGFITPHPSILFSQLRRVLDKCNLVLSLVEERLKVEMLGWASCWSKKGVYFVGAFLTILEACG